MDISEIENMWCEDCIINSLDLSGASHDIPKLHAKYYPIYNNAKRKLYQLKGLYKQLKADKIEFLNNPTEDNPNGWEPPDRLILKTEIPTFLDADRQLLKAELKIGEQDLIVGFLEDILKQISQRNWLIRNIIEDRKFMHGE